MKNPLEQLTNRPFSAAAPFTLLFQAAGIHDFAAAARHVLTLPYGRIADRRNLRLVLKEGRGSCTTKHALLAELACEQGIEVDLTLGIYEMSERNTPGVGRVLSAYGLEYMPEAHCYLRHESGRIDVTGVPAGAEPIDHFSMRSRSPSTRSVPTSWSCTNGSCVIGSPARILCAGGALRRSGESVKRVSRP